MQQQPVGPRHLGLRRLWLRSLPTNGQRREPGCSGPVLQIPEQRTGRLGRGLPRGDFCGTTRIQSLQSRRSKAMTSTRPGVLTRSAGWGRPPGIGRCAGSVRSADVGRTYITPIPRLCRFSASGLEPEGTGTLVMSA